MKHVTPVLVSSAILPFYAYFTHHDMINHNIHSDLTEQDMEFIQNLPTFMRIYSDTDHDYFESPETSPIPSPREDDSSSSPESIRHKTTFAAGEGTITRYAHHLSDLSRPNRQEIHQPQLPKTDADVYRRCDPSGSIATDLREQVLPLPTAQNRPEEVVRGRSALSGA